MHHVNNPTTRPNNLIISAILYVSSYVFNWALAAGMSRPRPQGSGDTQYTEALNRAMTDNFVSHQSESRMPCPSNQIRILL